MRLSSTLLLALCVACDDGGSSTPPADAAPPAMDGQVRDADLRDGGPALAPDIQLRPVALTLVSPEVGTASPPQTITVANVGDAPLTLAEVRIEPADPRFSLEGVPAAEAEVAPGDSLELSVRFTPDGAGEVRATVVLRSDDPDNGLATVTLTGRLQHNCLQVSPTVINMGTVQPGQQSGRFGVNLINCGDLEIDVQDVRVEGDPNFHWMAPQGRMAVGPLGAGGTLGLDLWYENLELTPGELARAHLIIESDAIANPREEVELIARGDQVLGCVPRFDPARLEFDVVRIGTESALEIQVKNAGSDPCAVRDISIEPTRGPAENTFTLSADIEGDVVPPQGSVTLTVTYAPQIADPIGDRAELHFDYRDPHLMENRRLTGGLLGIGAEALIGGVPDEVRFEDTTAPACASTERGTEATNVGFVPLCATGFRLEGENCGAFLLLEEPDFAECIPLLPDEGVPFTFVFQPPAVGVFGCILIVTSDAMNIAELNIPLRGEGVEGPATVDEFEVGRLNAMRRAYFGLSRPAVADSIQVFINDEASEDWGYDGNLNDIFFEVADHPDRGDEIRVEYDAECFPHREP